MVSSWFQIITANILMQLVATQLLLENITLRSEKFGRLLNADEQLAVLGYPSVKSLASAARVVAWVQV